VKAILPEDRLTAELARNLCAGTTPLSEFFRVSSSQVAAMALFGHDLLRQGRNQDAEKVFLGLIALDENIYYGHAGIGFLALSQGDLEAAERHLEKAVALAPSDPAVAVNLGEVLIRRGKIEPAMSVLARAVESDPSGNSAGATRARAILEALSLGAASMQDPQS